KTKLLRDLAFSELHGGRSAAVAELPISADSAGSIVQAWTGGVPVINEQPASEVGPPAAAAAAIGSAALLAIPVVWDGVVTEVVALYL
ncbi:MAG: hypothetical protein QFE16_08925, partial [Pseudomonadota bacterium]|nr:hypothetical protein [Pseudomonadota bacterium]